MAGLSQGDKAQPGMHESLPNMSKERSIDPEPPGSGRDFSSGGEMEREVRNYSGEGGTAQGGLGGSMGKYHPSHAKCWYCPLTSPTPPG